MTSFHDAATRFAALDAATQAQVVLGLLLAAALVLAALPERRRTRRAAAQPAATPVGALRRSRAYAPA